MGIKHLFTRRHIRVRPLAVVPALAAALILAPAAHSADPAQFVSEPAKAAVLAMGKTLSAPQFSFRVRTIREYADGSGQPLHIFHTATVLVQRPDHMRVDVTGDDGVVTLAYNGKE